MSWTLKTVKEINKRYLKERFSNEDIGYPRIIALDEVSVKKGHNYLTVIIDWESGKVLWVGGRWIHLFHNGG